VAEGQPTGWSSTRLATWLDIDRPAPPPSPAAPTSGSPTPSTPTSCSYGGAPRWCRYASGCRFRPGSATGTRWAAHRRRPRLPPHHPVPAGACAGFLELRYLDALDPWWRVAVAVVPPSCRTGKRATSPPRCAPVADRWADGARCGPDRPGLPGRRPGLCCGGERLRSPARALLRRHGGAVRPLRRALPAPWPYAGPRRPPRLAAWPIPRLPASGG
jgi:hypothetical protein